MKFLARSIFSILFISILSISNFSYAQSEPIENPLLNISEISIENKVYGPGDEISGTFILSNPTSFDLGDVYYTVSLVGSEDDSSRKFPKAYDFGIPVGPNYIASGESKLVSFSYGLPNYKPAQHLGIRLDAFLKSGQRLGNAEIHLDTEGEIVPQLNVSNPTISVEEFNFKISQRTVIYQGEDAYFSYVLENSLSESVKIEPQITIRKEGEVGEVLAKYKDRQIQINPDSSVDIVNEIRTFEDASGLYVARIDFLDDKGFNRASPIVFRYVVDGDVASIKSIFTDIKSVKRGENFDVRVKYEGKPYDMRDLEDSRLVKDAFVFIEVKDINGDLVSKDSVQIDLEPSGEVLFSLSAEKSSKDLEIKVRISKEGETLSEGFLDIPPANDSGFLPMYIYPLATLLIIIIVIFLIHKHLKDKGLLVSMLLALSFFGFANSVYAINQSFTTVYTVGDPEYIPTNISIDATGQEHYYSDSFVTIYYDAPEPATFDTEFHNAYSMWSGADCRYYSGSCSYATDLWTEGPPASVLTAGSCEDGEVCDEENYNYWGGGTTLESGEYCDFNGCQDTGYSNYYTPDDNGGTYRLYIYIRNEYEVSDCTSGNCVYDTVGGSALVYTDISFYDLTPDEAYCAAYITSSGVATEGGDIPTGTDITWYVNTEYNQSGDPNPNACQSECINGNEIYDSEPDILRWGGDIGDTASSTISDPSSDYIPRDLIEWYQNSTLYCQNYAEDNVTSTCDGCEGWQADFENGRCIQNGQTYEQQYICETIDLGCDDTGYCETYEDCRYEDVTTNTTDIWNVPGASEIYGTSFTTTYSTSTLPASSTLSVYLQYKDQAAVSWNTVSCILSDVGIDLCPNLVGVQSTIPVGYDVYPDPEDVGTNGITYGDLNCYPVSLAQSGTLTVTANPVSGEVYADIDENVDWEFSLSSDYFVGILNGVTFNIPRFVDISWFGDLTDSAYTSGIGSSSNQSNVNIPDASLTGVNNTETVSYSEAGSATVGVEIYDPYLTLNATSTITVSPPVCVDECAPCDPPDEICDNGVDGDESVVNSFTASPAVVNEGEQCSLSWNTNDETYSCDLVSPNTTTSVATSSVGYLVDPGEYYLHCYNYAPELTVAGPLNCVLNPNIKEN